MRTAEKHTNFDIRIPQTQIQWPQVPQEGGMKGVAKKGGLKKTINLLR